MFLKGFLDWKDWHSCQQKPTVPNLFEPEIQYENFKDGVCNPHKEALYAPFSASEIQLPSWWRAEVFSPQDQNSRMQIQRKQTVQSRTKSFDYGRRKWKVAGLHHSICNSAWKIWHVSGNIRYTARRGVCCTPACSYDLSLHDSESPISQSPLLSGDRTRHWVEWIVRRINQQVLQCQLRQMADIWYSTDIRIQPISILTCPNNLFKRNCIRYS